MSEHRPSSQPADAERLIQRPSGQDPVSGRALELPRFDPSAWLEAPEPLRTELIRLEARLLRARHKADLARDFVRRAGEQLGESRLPDSIESHLAQANAELERLHELRDDLAAQLPEPSARRPRR